MTPSTTSPQSRLAASRKALVRQMARSDGRDEDALPHNSQETNQSSASADDHRDSVSTWQVFRQAAAAWWQHHPAQVAFDIGRPFLSNYARSKPLQLLAIAAGVGAAAVLVKPWRLISVTGLAVAAFKSTSLRSTVMSLLHGTAPRFQNKTVKPAKDAV